MGKPRRPAERVANCRSRGRIWFEEASAKLHGATRSSSKQSKRVTRRGGNCAEIRSTNDEGRLRLGVDSNLARSATASSRHAARLLPGYQAGNTTGASRSAHRHLQPRNDPGQPGLPAEFNDPTTWRRSSPAGAICSRSRPTASRCCASDPPDDGVGRRHRAQDLRCSLRAWRTIATRRSISRSIWRGLPGFQPRDVRTKQRSCCQAPRPAVRHLAAQQPAALSADDAKRQPDAGVDPADARHPQHPAPSRSLSGTNAAQADSRPASRSR